MLRMKLVTWPSPLAGGALGGLDMDPAGPLGESAFYRSRWLTSVKAGAAKCAKRKRLRQTLRPEDSMNAPNPIQSVSDLYAHALAVEREAASRYAELAQYMSDHGNEPVAELFRRLSQLETEHAEAIVARTRDLELPALKPWEHSWFDAGPPEALSHDLLFRLMTPHDALKLALEAEQRARDYFERIFSAAQEVEVKALAAAMAQEEAQHIVWVERALAADPDPNPDWDRIFAHARLALGPGRGTTPARAKAAGKAGAKKAAPKKPAGKKAATTKAATTKVAAKKVAAKHAAAGKRPGKTAVGRKLPGKKPSGRKVGAKRAAQRLATKKAATKKAKKKPAKK
jgi:rubrerythrin